jgi:hypothetical protein
MKPKYPKMVEILLRRATADPEAVTQQPADVVDSASGPDRPTPAALSASPGMMVKEVVVGGERFELPTLSV